MENGVEGKVILRFVVNTDGTIGDITVLQGADSSLNEEAVRVVSEMPQWSPGRQNGRPVRVYYTVPVHFKINY